MVLCYHLQHPSLYSPEGLENARGLLVDFVEGGLTPAEARRRNRSKVDSSRREYKIKATPTSHGVYKHPVAWTMTAGDVVAGGAEAYRESVREWARSVISAIRRSEQTR